MNTAINNQCAACGSTVDADSHCSFCVPPAPVSSTGVTGSDVFDRLTELQREVGVTNGADFLDMTMREYGAAMGRDGWCAQGHGLHRAKSCSVCVRLARAGQ